MKSNVYFIQATQTELV